MGGECWGVASFCLNSHSREVAHFMPPLAALGPRLYYFIAMLGAHVSSLRHTIQPLLSGVLLLL